MASLPSRARAYIVTVSVVGAGMFVWFVAQARDAAPSRPMSIALLMALVVLGEMAPIRVPFHGSTQDITLSTTFVFALVLLGEYEVAVIAQVVASTVTDALNHKPWWKTGFNATQYVISVAAAALVFEAMTSESYSRIAAITPQSLLAVLAAGMTLYVVNNLLIGVAIATSAKIPLIALLRDDLLFQVTVVVVLLSQAPLVVLASDHGTWLVPLFVPAVAVAYLNGLVSVQRNHDALHDALTALPNRAHLEQRLRNDLAAGDSIAVLLADLDHFRDVNDTLGLGIGDRLLVEIGARIRESAGPESFVARFGGDEFAVVATVATPADVDALGARVAASFELPFALESMPFHVSASVGCALGPEHGNDPDLLLRRAEIAMHVAKERRSRLEHYGPGIDRYDPRRLKVLGGLGKVVERGQLEIRYQPKASFATGEVCGAEALIRWHHPEFGLVPPDEFVPLAEATGAIDTITRFLLDQTIRQCAEWRRYGWRLSVAVNVSPRNLQDATLVEHAAGALSRHDVPAELLEVEITESGAMRDLATAQLVLGRLRALGCRIALDDFGTGHSSLAHLRRLPVDTLKIDKSFVLGMATDDDDAAITVSTVRLAHSLGLSVVAEGVENEPVWRRLAAEGCEYAQGYYLSRPLDAASFATWLRTSGHPVRRVPAGSAVRELQPITQGPSLVQRGRACTVGGDDPDLERSTALIDLDVRRRASDET